LNKLKRTRNWAKKAWPLIVAVIVTLVGLALWPVFTAPPGDLGVQQKPMIRQLIYPTFGNPAIVSKGGAMTIEFDPRDRDFHKWLKTMTNFQVTASTADGVYPVTVALPVQSAKKGPSARWPEYAGRKVYLVTVVVPRSLPQDLYNLVVSGVMDGQEVSDFQPHALSAVDQYKDRFSFCQLTDIHVFGPECTFGSAVYHDRTGRPNGVDLNRKGAVYYEKAIQQINTVKPDFCIFTGDYMFGQSYLLLDQGDPWGLTTEYEYEMMWFYQETMKLDVPVFLTPGNHDSFAEGQLAAHEDWFQNWRDLFGPVYHSFDYGDYHFLALNAQDWPVKDRTLQDLSVAIQSEKYKGQFDGNGDKYEPGVSIERLAKIDESKFTGQLKWMRDDLAAHQGSKMRIVATHQDPWRKDGSGTMWASAGSDATGMFGAIKSALGFAGKYGDGAGRLAAVRLMSEYRVGLEVSGHFHSDNIEVFPWADGTGQVIDANTTCVQFNVDGPSGSYPGYRRVWINNGKVESVNYAEPQWSYPLFAGTNVGGTTDLSKLETPAVSVAFVPAPGTATDVAATFTNSLAKPLPAAFCEFPMPNLTGGYYYQIAGGTLGESRDDGSGAAGHRVFAVYANVAPGENRAVRVFKSAAPDNIAPTGGLTINNGAPTTASGSVVLQFSASDSGGSGLKDMMVSNSPDFTGARWERYESAIPWDLAGDDDGVRTVYVKFRDNAMPANVSAVAQASITFNPPPTK